MGGHALDVTSPRKRRRQRTVADMLRDARRRAEREGLPFDLRREDVDIPEFCPVLGMLLVHGEGRAGDCSPSLDKIIPAKGYVRGNVRVISLRANRLKSDAAPDELAKLLAYVLHETQVRTVTRPRRKH